MSELDSPQSIDSAVAGRARPTIVEQRFTVENECHGWRLDRFLQKRIRRLSRNRIQRVIQGDCDVAGRPARAGMRVLAGQLVSFRRPAPDEPEVPRDIAIAHSDPCFYVIEKPAGLPIHPTGRYHCSTLTAVLRERFPTESLQVAHRLDRETSGLMLIARTAQAASFLKTAFQRRVIRKRYLAIVHGIVASDQLVLDQPIGPARGVVRVRMAVRAIEDGGQPSRTEVQVLGRGRRFSLLECRPHTGRQHQIRVHLDAIGHPIVGDKLYPDEQIFLRWVARSLADSETEDESETAAPAASDSWPGQSATDDDATDDDATDDDATDLTETDKSQSANRSAADDDTLLLPRHALHAAGLIFPHPLTGELVEVQSKLPTDLADFFASDC